MISSRSQCDCGAGVVSVRSRCASEGIQSLNWRLSIRASIGRDAVVMDDAQWSPGDQEAGVRCQTVTAVMVSICLELSWMNWSTAGITEVGNFSYPRSFAVDVSSTNFGGWASSDASMMSTAPGIAL